MRDGHKNSLVHFSLDSQSVSNRAMHILPTRTMYDGAYLFIVDKELSLIPILQIAGWHDIARAAADDKMENEISDVTTKLRSDTEFVKSNIPEPDGQSLPATFSLIRFCRESKMAITVYVEALEHVKTHKFTIQAKNEFAISIRCGF